MSLNLKNYYLSTYYYFNSLFAAQKKAEEERSRRALAADRRRADAELRIIEAHRRALRAVRAAEAGKLKPDLIGFTLTFFFLRAGAPSFFL